MLKTTTASTATSGAKPKATLQAIWWHGLAPLHGLEPLHPGFDTPRKATLLDLERFPIQILGLRFSVWAMTMI